MAAVGAPQSWTQMLTASMSRATAACHTPPCAVTTGNDVIAVMESSVCRHVLPTTEWVVFQVGGADGEQTGQQSGVCPGASRSTAEDPPGST